MFSKEIMLVCMISIKNVSPEEYPYTDNLFQSAFWGTFKNISNQKPLFFMVSYKDDPICKDFPLLVLLRHIGKELNYAYAPKAPSISIPSEKRGILLEELALELKPLLPKNCICIRFDIGWRSQYGGNEILNSQTVRLAINWGTKTHKLIKAANNHLAADTVIINLALTPEEILSRMRSTTRNCIRRSYKSSVDFIVGSEDLLDTWYELYKQTGKRKKFYYENKQYFENIFKHKKDMEKNFTVSKSNKFTKEIIPLQAPAPLPDFYILAAQKEEKMLSGILLAISGHNAYYMYAGSNLEASHLMPNYGLQWEAIRFARSKGCTNYDLMGIPPNMDETHPMAGLYIFKTGFGGEKIKFAGAWDYPFDEKLYNSLQAAELNLRNIT